MARRSRARRETKGPVRMSHKGPRVRLIRDRALRLPSGRCAAGRRTNPTADYSNLGAIEIAIAATPSYSKTRTCFVAGKITAPLEGDRGHAACSYAAHDRFFNSPGSADARAHWRRHGGTQ